MPWLHKSSWVVATLTLVLCVLVVVPGQITDTYIPPQPYFSHGWPLTFLERDVDDTWHYADGRWFMLSVNWPIHQPPSYPPWMLWDSWRFWHAKENIWRPLNFAIDVGTMFAIVAVVTTCWEFRRRRRGNAFQFRLVEFFVITALVACVLGWMHSHSVAYAEEQNALRACQQDDSSTFGCPYGRCVAPVWLQRLIGFGSFPQYFFPHHEAMLVLDFDDKNEIDHLVACLQQLKYLNTVYIIIDTKDFATAVEARIRERLPHVRVDPED